jgi:hypothetical protein
VPGLLLFTLILRQQILLLIFFFFNDFTTLRDCSALQIPFHIIEDQCALDLPVPFSVVLLASQHHVDNGDERIHCLYRTASSISNLLSTE